MLLDQSEIYSKQMLDEIEKMIEAPDDNSQPKAFID
jgi:hypothetical protein